MDAQHQAVAGVAEAQGGCRGALPPLLLGQQHVLGQAQARQVCQHAAARAVVQVLRGGVVDGDRLAAAVVLPEGLPCQCSGLLVIGSTTLKHEWGCSCSILGGCASLGIVGGYGVGASLGTLPLGWGGVGFLTPLTATSGMRPASYPETKCRFLSASCSGAARSSHGSCATRMPYIAVKVLRTHHPRQECSVQAPCCNPSATHPALRLVKILSGRRRMQARILPAHDS